MLFCRFCLALAALSVGAEAAALSLRGEYSVSVRGFPVGEARLKAEIDDNSYAVEFSGRISGLVRLFTDMRASAQSSGSLTDGRLRPAEYSQKWAEDDDAEAIGMRFDGATATDISIEPPVRRPERYLPVTDAHRTGSLDPASAVIWPGGAEACDRTLAIFDGRRRFDLKLRFSREETFAARDGSYSGPAIVCAIRYRPVSGHRPGRKSVKFMAANEDMEVWMAPLAEGFLAPVSIRVRAHIGRVVIEAKRLSVD